MPTPVQVKDKETGQLVEIQPDQLGDAVLSGRFLVPEGTLVPVVDTDGSINSLPVEMLTSGAAEQAGVRTAQSSEITEWRKQKMYGEGVGNAVRAAGDAAFNELLLGAGDAAQIGLGRDPEELREIRARNEVAATVGAAGGIILPIAATFGTGAAARGAVGLTGQALRMTPTALLARGGAAAQRQITKALGGSFLARVTAASAVGGLEGAVYSTGSALSTLAREGEDVLGDHETVAEYLLANAGQGALIGAGAGFGGEALISGIGAGFGKVRDLFGKRRAAQQLADDASEEAITAAVKQDARAAKLPTAEAENAVAKIIGDRRAFRELPTTQDAAIRKLAKLGDEAEEVFERAESRMPLSKKYRSVIEAIRTSDDVATPEAVALETHDTLKRIRSVLAEAADDPDGKIASTARRALKQVSATERRLGTLGKVATNLEGEALALQGPAKPAGLERTFIELDKLKRALGGIRKGMGGRVDMTMDPLGANLATQLTAAYNDLATTLENKALFGAKASGIQVGDNRAWVPWFDVRGGYQAELLKQGQYGGARTSDGFGLIARADPAKLGTLVKGAIEPEGALRMEVMARNFDSSVDLLKQLAKTHSPGPEVQALVKRYEAIATEMTDTMLHVREQASRAKAHQDFAADVAFAPGIASKAIAVAERAHSIVTTSKTASAIEAKLSAAINGIANRLGSGKPARVVVPALESLDANETRRDYYARRREEIQQLLADPAIMAGRSVSVANPNHTPTVAAHVAQKTALAAEFLESKAPAERSRHPLRPDLDKHVPVSEIEARKWLRYLSAVENPIGVLERAAEGDVSREGVETLQVVYPKFYERLLTDVVERISDMDKLPNMRESQELSLLLGAPLHFTMRPEFIRSYQETYARRRQEMAGATPPSARPTGASRVAQQMATETQRLEGGL